MINLMGSVLNVLMKVLKFVVRLNDAVVDQVQLQCYQLTTGVKVVAGKIMATTTFQR